ncbi:MAG: hypothetical protein U5K74_01500 [Gemmatimonadaceae bacterium]|nr:hypothetical protein [Gemmatimonadaceae bacterium]
MDAPRRFGDQSLAVMDLGQTGAWMEWDRVAVGLLERAAVAGPGLNAALPQQQRRQFGDAFARTRRPNDHAPRARRGAEYLLGTLTQSQFFEIGSPTNPAREYFCGGRDARTARCRRTDPRVVAGRPGEHRRADRVLDTCSMYSAPYQAHAADRDPTQIRGGDDEPRRLHDGTSKTTVDTG